MTTEPGWQIALEENLAVAVEIRARVGGGDFAEAFCVDTADGRSLFVKTHRNPPADFFSTEALGLQWLRSAECVAVPEVLAVCDSPPFLALEWIALGEPRVGTEEDFGRALAELHRSGHTCFGRVDGKTTGSLAVPNDPASTWVEFFAQRRLLPLVQIARERGSLPTGVQANLEKLAGRLDTLDVPTEPAALLHGDLWAGNRVVDQQGRSWLIDPAAHGGHREFDLAMMKLFGGFGDVCFSAYHESYALAPGWQQRVSLHQLAPLIVHAIKFGGAYVESTRDALSFYT